MQHQAIDRLRRRAREEAALQTAPDAGPEGLGLAPEDALLRQGELGAALARLFGTLSPAERLALVLHEVFECGHADIAAVLGTKPVNARQQLARARRRLRQVEGQEDAAARDAKLCRELVRRFQAALAGADLPAMVSILGAEQPVSVSDAPPPRAGHRRTCANDPRYTAALAAWQFALTPNSVLRSGNLSLPGAVRSRA